MGPFLSILVMEVSGGGLVKFSLLNQHKYEGLSYAYRLSVKKCDNCLLTSRKDEVDITKGRNMWH